MAKLSSTSVYGNLYVDGEIVNNALDAELGQSIKSLSVNGKTITYTKNNGTTGTIITQDTNTTYGNATTSTSGLMSSADKTKLDGIATNANNYSHPTTSGNKHIPAGGSSGQILRWASDGTAAWGNDNNTTYSTGTASTAGLTKLYTGTGTATDGTMTQSAINTALNGKASSSHTHNSIINQDTRNVNTTPTQMPLGLSVHLKSNSTDGLNDGGTYHSTLMIKGWEDVSGGPWAQMTVTANNNLYFRSSNNDTWNAWRKVSLDGHTHNYAGSSSAGGAANSAVKATQDSAGQQINTTYIKGLSVSGKTITYTKGDGTTGTITTQDTNTTYSTGTASALGLTKLYTSTGTATDGTMTQAAINTALGGKANSSHGTHVPSTCNTITDWNSATTTGWYMANGATNAPTANAWYFGEVIAHNTNYVIQTVYQFTASTDAKAIPKYIRAKMNGTWGSWTNVTVAKAVPSNAVFTDTNTWRGVQDNLTSTATDQSLSANQGKVLKGLIDGKAASSHTHYYAGSSSEGGVANSATVLATARKINGTSFNGSADITTANWGTTRTITIGKTGKSVNGSGNVSWTLDEMGAASRSPFSNTYKQITVGGDANTYYPVLITMNRPGIGYPWYNISISRAYNATAPDTWNTATHKGGLTFQFRWSGDNGWGGNDHNLQVVEFSESYTTMVAGFTLSVSGIVVWLRGGGALYQLNCEQGIGINATVTLGTYTSEDKTTYPVRTNTNSVANEIHKLWVQRGGSVYDNNSRVYSPNNKPTPSAIGALPLAGGTLTGKIEVPGESTFYQGTYVDPWEGTLCAIKASGDVGIGGALKVNESIAVSQKVGASILEASTDLILNRYGFSSFYTNNAAGSYIYCGKNDSSINLTDNKLIYANPNGNIQIGPQNSSHCHIYTDKPTFYFNKDLLVNGSKVYHEGNKPTPGAIGAAPALAFANSYYGMVTNDGNSSNWIRTTQNGIIPYQSNSGGSSSLGTSGWPFSTVYATNFYGTLNGNATHWGGRQVWWGAAGSRPGNGYIQFVW